MYYIGTETKYITQESDGKMSITECFDDAKLYSTRLKAGQALVSLPRSFYEASASWGVHEYIMNDTCDNSSDDINRCDIQETKNDNPSISTVGTTERSDKDYMAILKTLGELKEGKAGCLTYLNTKLSEANQEVMDIEHYIEFNKLNASCGYGAYKMLYNALKKRRAIKDNIIAAKAIYDSCDMNTIMSRILQMNNRRYKPRQLPELFTDMSKE